MYTPDGKYIAFNRANDFGTSCPQNTGTSAGVANSGGTYDNCMADVYMVPAEGGTAM